MRYTLDTNAVIGLLNEASPAIGARLLEHDRRDVGLSAIVLYELYFGAFKSRLRSLNLARFDALPLEILSFEREDARHAAEIRAVLSARGRPIGPYDLLIAGQARARDLIVVSNNVREFGRVDGLRVEDWSV